MSNVINDLSQKLNGDNGVLVGVSVTVLLISASVIFFLSSKPKTSQKPKELTPVEKILYQFKQLEDKYQKFNETSIEEYFEKFNDLNDEDRSYRFNFISEELLKLLISLDGVEISFDLDDDTRQELKLVRKGLIKDIQSKQKQVEQVKKGIIPPPTPTSTSVN